LSDLGAGRFEEADVHPAVLSYLAQQWSGTVLNNAAAASFHQVDPSLRLNLKLRHVSVEDELFHVLRNVSPGQFAGAAAATLVSDLARHEPVGAAGAVLRYLELAPDLYANASLVRRFAPWPPGGSHALICLEELFARTSGRGMSAHPPHVVLGSFAAWTSLIRLRDQQEGRLVTLFVSYLTALVKALPSSMGAAALGACYLRLVPGEAHALVRVVVDRFRSAESQIAEQRPLTFDRPPFAVIGDLFPVIVRYGPRDTYGVLLASIGRSAERAGAERTSELIADVERYCHLTKADMPRELRQYLKNRPSSGWSFFS
jgi:hypothetical protein